MAGMQHHDDDDDDRIRFVGVWPGSSDSLAVINTCLYYCYHPRAPPACQSFPPGPGRVAVDVVV
jgi:hypothetical protein